jgi:hypothetical protein
LSEETPDGPPVCTFRKYSFVVFSVENNDCFEKNVESENMPVPAGEQPQKSIDSPKPTALEVLTFRDRSQSGNVAPDTDSARREARIVVYEAPAAVPRILRFPHQKNIRKHIEALTSTTHNLCRQQGAAVPYPIIRALVENFIHADFIEPVISILPNSKTLIFADQGRGIRHKSWALNPGFSSANSAMKAIIAGVGSGLPAVMYFAHEAGGSLSVKDNLDGGCVVTLCLEPQEQQKTSHTTVPQAQAAPSFSVDTAPSYPAIPAVSAAGLDALPHPSVHKETNTAAVITLSERQREVLVVVADYSVVGPSQVSDLLGISLATAYRDLALLERRHLVSAKDGKSSITPEGTCYLDRYVFGGGIGFAEYSLQQQR